MRCANCGFENIPDLQACARCQSLLDLGGVDVVPPRSPPSRLRTRWERFRFSLGARISSLGRFLPRWRIENLPQVSWRIIPLSIVPGLWHLRSNHRRAGWTFLSIWIGFLLMALLTLPSGWVPWFVAFAIATHATAAISPLAVSLKHKLVVVRALFGILVFLALSFFVYRPIGWTLERFLAPIVLSNLLPGEVVNDGDGILYEGPWLRPGSFARGDVVVYRIRGRYDLSNHIFIPEGLGLDRILGAPGDRIEIRKGALLVNGEPPPREEAPLGPLPKLPEIEVVLKEGQYAILPSRLRIGLPRNLPLARNARIVENWLCEMTIVPQEYVLGRVIIRLKPLTRFGPVR